jgi:hypothetical protein
MFSTWSLIGAVSMMSKNKLNTVVVYHDGDDASDMSFNENITFEDVATVKVFNGVAQVSPSNVKRAQKFTLDSVKVKQ